MLIIAAENHKWRLTGHAERERRGGGHNSATLTYSDRPRETQTTYSSKKSLQDAEEKESFGERGRRREHYRGNAWAASRLLSSPVTAVKEL